MGKINWLKTYLQEIQDEITEINSNKLLIDKSTLTKYLEAHQTDNNMLLVGVIPDLNGKGANGDEFKLTVVTQLMVLKKTTYSEVNYDEFIQIFEDTYVVMEKVLAKMLEESLKGCNNLRFLNTSSLKIVPVWNLSSCNGCKLMFNFDMFL